MAIVDRSSTSVSRAFSGRPTTNIETTLLLALIIVMPILASPPMATRILDISGFKIPNLIAGFALLAFVNTKATWRIRDRLQRAALTVFSGYLMILTVAFIRSMPNISRFHAIAPDTYQANFSEYWQSFFALPVLFSLTFVYVLQHMCSPAGIKQTLSAISVAMFVLSCAVIAIMLSHPAAVLDMGPNRAAVNALTASYLGLQYNNVGTIYIIAAPLLLYLAVRGGPLWSLNFIMAIVAVLLLKSRTAILTFAAMSIVTLIVLGRTRTLFALGPVIAGGVLVVLGKVLIGILSIGISRSGISTYLLLSGREQAIWLPLIAEWTSDPGRFWFGAGLFGLMTSDFLYSARSIFAAGNAHSFYLEFFLDNGIVAFCLFVCALLWWLFWSWRLGRRVQSQLYWVLFLCVVSFLIAGFTGRRYFPECENMLLFPITATLINVVRLKLQRMATAAEPYGTDGRESVATRREP